LVFNLKRLSSGLVLILILALSFYLKLDYFLLIFLSVFIGFELFKNNLSDKVLLTISSFLFFLIYFLFIHFNQIKIYLFIFLLFFIFYMFQTKKYNFVITFSSFYFLLSAFFILLDSRDIFYLTVIFCFVNDTLAYIFGNIFKGPKIIPKISPNKTWSGTLLSLIISTYLFFTFLNFDIFTSILISSLIFFGDIFFSFFKRVRNIKDYSNLIPGHGGVLDRLDSFILPIIFIFSFII